MLLFILRISEVMHGSPYANTKNYAFSILFFLSLYIWKLRNNRWNDDDCLLEIVIFERETIKQYSFPIEKKTFDEEFVFFDWELESICMLLLALKIDEAKKSSSLPECNFQ